MRRLLCIVVGVAVLGPVAAARADYQVPADNPFVGVAGAQPAVYAYGLRNPYRFSFDRLTGDVLIGDVGGGQREEIDWVTLAGARGANFGWACREGTVAGPRTDECPVPGAVEPLFDYPTDSPDAVTGGFVVRDPSLVGLVGRYLYADYFTGAIRSLALVAGAPDDKTTNATVPTLASFGEDASGRLYAVNRAGNAVVRLVSAGPGALTTAPIGGTFASPVAIGTFPGDAERLFVAEQTGNVRLVVNGSALPTPFLDVAQFGLSTVGTEQGLLSVVAAPDYATSGKLYVYYTGTDGDIVVDEVTRSTSNPEIADPTTRRNVLTIEHSAAANHNGGQMHFGPDGCMWITTGDGGGQNNQFDNAQNRGTLLGKVLRIDPDPPGSGGPVCGGRATPPAPPIAMPISAPGPPAGSATRTLIRRRQPVLARKGVIVRFRCRIPPNVRFVDVPRCKVRATGRLRIGRRSLALKPARRTVAGGATVRLKVRLTRRARRALRAAIEDGRRARVRVRVRSVDVLGRVRTVRRTVRVVHPPRRAAAAQAVPEVCSDFRADLKPMSDVLKRGAVSASFRCRRRARVRLRGHLETGSVRIPFEPVTATGAARERTTVEVPLTAAGRKALRRALDVDVTRRIVVVMRAKTPRG